MRDDVLTTHKLDAPGAVKLNDERGLAIRCARMILSAPGEKETEARIVARYLLRTLGEAPFWGR